MQGNSPSSKKLMFLTMFMLMLGCPSLGVWNAVGQVEADERLLRIGTEDSLTKVFCDEPFRGNIDGALQLRLARGEYEAGQLVLIVGSHRIEKVRLECTDLVHENGRDKIEQKHVQLNFVGYTAPTAIRSQQVLKNRNLKLPKPKRYPDPLLLDHTITLEPRTVQPVWVTVFAPPDAVPGGYSATITIYSGKRSIGMAKLQVHVWDFKLPDMVPLYVWYYNDFNRFARNWLGVTPDDWDRYKLAFRHYVREIVRHHGSIALPLSYKAGRRFEEIMRIMTEEGCRYWWVTWFWHHSAYVNQPEEEQRRIARHVYDYMKAHGWLEATFFVTWDEPDLRPELKENRIKWERHIRVLKEIGFPRIQVEMTWRCAKATDFMEPYPTVWNPQFSYFEREYFYDFLQKQRREGDIIGFYLTGSGRGTEPRHYITYPLTDMRRLFYYMWHHGLSLVEFWALDITWRKKGKDPFTMIVKGDGYGGGTSALIYPNLRKDLTRPFLSSLRFEAIRDGIEDYYYLWLLAQLIKSKQAQGDRESAEMGKRLLEEISAKFGKHLRDYQLNNPDDYMRARRKLAEMILYLKSH